MPKAIVLFFLIILSQYSFSQRFGGNPPSLKWKQVNTDTARIIFPAGLDSQAQRVSSIVHHLASQKPVALGDKLYKINIVLQNQTTIANGYVGLGPYRSEFFLTPFMDNFQEGTIPWADQLAIHEYRHVQQFNNFRTGLSKAMYVLFGQEGYALAINASIPDWFYEGDAVYNETILSKQGRGRLPLFLNAYPSLWQAGKDYSWMKLRNGSFKDYVPNHYYLGYLLVNYGREKYGLDFWSKVTKDAAGFKGLFYPFQKAVKKYAGVDYKTFTQQAFEFYKSKTPAPISSPQVKESLLPVQKEYVTNYLFPYKIGADSLLYLRTSYRHRPSFYIKSSAGEHLLRVKDISIDEQFSYRNGKLVYAAYETDPRWSWRDYSVIKVLDINTNKQKTLRHKTKYFTPDISYQGEKIAAVEVAADGRSELHVLDAKNGEIISRLRAADIRLFTDPKFINENSLVCGVRLLDGKSALAVCDLQTGSIERLTPPSFNAVGYPVVSDNATGVIYFTASYGGNDDVFAVRLSDKKIYKVSSGPLGNYYVNAGNGKVTWSAFTAEGYQLRQMDEKDIRWDAPVSDIVLDKTEAKFAVSHSNDVQDILLTSAGNRQFPVRNYSKSKGLFNFHSWRPYYEDPLFTFSLYGENVLNTLQTEIYYLYNQNDRTNAAGVSAVYGRWFPYLSVGSQMTFAIQDSVGNLLRQWNELNTRVGINVPLSFTSGRTFKSLNVGTNYFIRNEFNTGPNKDLLGKDDFTYLHHFISWTQQVQRAVQHIFPRLGYSVSVNRRYPVTNLKAYQFITSGAVYLPGILSNHSLVLTGAFQQRDTSRFLFSSGIVNARGYSDYYRSDAGSRIWRLSVNYHLPLLHPDWGFGNILYLQRIRANLFYDIQRFYSNNKQLTADLPSIGVELYVDTKWWNQYELTFGFRISHLMENDPQARIAKGGNVFEFILPVSIIPR